MNLKEIKEMINLMNENNLVELEIEREGTKIKIRRASLDGAQPTRVPSVEYRVESTAFPKSTERPTQEPSLPKGSKEITSPMVGTFYRSPSPEAAPFVEVGQMIEVGQVVCIIEAMKLMNEIKSEIRGRVAEVAVENAEPVEFGQTLFVIEPQ